MSDAQTKRMSDLLFVSGFPEGETLYSCLHRNFEYSRVRDFPAAFKRAFHCKPGLRGTPTNIGEIYAAFAYRFRSFDELIAKNTEYPLYLKGLPEEKKSQLIERITGKVPGPARPTRPPLLFGSSSETAKYCPECSEQRRYDLGFTYQHLRENAPYVEYCPIHGKELRSSNVQLPLQGHGDGRYEVDLPHLPQPPHQGPFAVPGRLTDLVHRVSYNAAEHDEE